MEVMIFALIDEGLHRPPEFLGVLSTAQGVGAVIGGVVVGATMRKIGEFPTIAWALVAIGVGVGLLAWASSRSCSCRPWRRDRRVLLQRGVRDAVQRRTDVAMQGRVMSARRRRRSPCRTRPRSRAGRS